FTAPATPLAASHLRALTQGEQGMIRKYAGAAFLIVAMAIPAATLGQDGHRDENRQDRYYDSNHKDYHEWNDNENQQWQQYQTERHKQYGDFSHASRRRQQAYWKWRHEHNNDDHRD